MCVAEFALTNRSWPILAFVADLDDVLFFQANTTDDIAFVIQEEHAAHDGEGGDDENDGRRGPSNQRVLSRIRPLTRLPMH